MSETSGDRGTATSASADPETSPDVGTAARTGRLPWPGPDELGPAARRVYEAIVSGPRAAHGDASGVVDASGRLLGPFNAMVLASPGTGDALQRLGTEIRYGSALSDRVRELAVLTVAAERSSRFEWFAHAQPATAAGLTDDMLEAVARRDTGFFDGDDALVHRAVRELLQSRDLSQRTFEELEDLLGTSAVVDLVILVGYYDLLALALRAFRVPLPE